MLFLMPAMSRVMETDGVPAPARQEAVGLGDTAAACAYTCLTSSAHIRVQIT